MVKRKTTGDFHFNKIQNVTCYKIVLFFLSNKCPNIIRIIIKDSSAGAFWLYA